MCSPQFATLSKTKNQNAAISGDLTKLMAQDVAWYQLIPTLQTTAQTSGLSLTNIAALQNVGSGVPVTFRMMAIMVVA